MKKVGLMVGDGIQSWMVPLSYIAFLVWMEDMCRTRPTHIIHECVRGFDASSLRGELESLWVSADDLCTYEPWSTVSEREHTS